MGELRDLENIRLALTAAETGHLVFGTLHTTSAAKTIDRVIDVFPAAEKALVRSMLSESLRAVISQTLLKKKSGADVLSHRDWPSHRHAGHGSVPAGLGPEAHHHGGGGPRKSAAARQHFVLTPTAR